MTRVFASSAGQASSGVASRIISIDAGSRDGGFPGSLMTKTTLFLLILPMSLNGGLGVLKARGI